MDFSIPANVTAYLAELDAFIEKEIKPLERENDNIRFFDHRREWARTDFERIQLGQVGGYIGRNIKIHGVSPQAITLCAICPLAHIGQMRISTPAAAMATMPSTTSDSFTMIAASSPPSNPDSDSAPTCNA